MSSAAEARGQANALPTDPTAAIPREYNFAADIIDRNLKAGRAGKPAFIDPRGSWTYGQLADRVARFASALRALGVQREERILICLADTIDWPTAFLGALKAGVVAVPVNTLMTEDDYRFMLADSRARMLVVSEGLYPKFAKLIGEFPDLVHVVVSGDNAQGHRRFEELVTSAAPDPATPARHHARLALALGGAGRAPVVAGPGIRGRRDQPRLSRLPRRPRVRPEPAAGQHRAGHESRAGRRHDDRVLARRRAHVA